jgi:hypothetical protein
MYSHQGTVDTRAVSQVHIQAARQGLQKGGEGRESRKAEGAVGVALGPRCYIYNTCLGTSRAETERLVHHFGADAQVKKAIEKDQIDNAKIYAQVCPAPICQLMAVSQAVASLSVQRKPHPCPGVDQASCEPSMLQNAIRKKNEALNYLRLGSRLDAVVSRLDTQARASGHAALWGTLCVSDRDLCRQQLQFICNSYSGMGRATGVYKLGQ